MTLSYGIHLVWDQVTETDLKDPGEGKSNTFEAAPLPIQALRPGSQNTTDAAIYRRSSWNYRGESTEE